MSYDETISTREDDYEEHDTEYPDEKEKKLTEYDSEVSEEYDTDTYDTADEGNIYNEKNAYNDADEYDTEEICDTADAINHDENITSYDNEEVSSAGSNIISRLFHKKLSAILCQKLQGMSGNISFHL